MIMIALEGHVAEERWPDLVAAYEAGSKNMPGPMLQMFLAQDVNDRTLWRAITVWRSREALIEYRQSAQGHPGDAMFRAAGAEPVSQFMNVMVHGPAEAS